MIRTATLAAAIALLPAAVATASPGMALAGPSAILCAIPAAAGAPYYTIDLVPTGRVPGTRQTHGEAAVSFAASPFGLSVTAGGQYVYNIDVDLRDLAGREGEFVVWVARADLGEIHRAGPLDESMTLATTVEWNKFLVVVTMEPEGTHGDTWTGPIVFRGMSRSGRMHTMAGHGPFQAEPCAKYGY